MDDGHSPETVVTCQWKCGYHVCILTKGCLALDIAARMNWFGGVRVADG